MDIFLFRTINGKTLVFQFDRNYFIRFQQELSQTSYRLIYFGKLYPHINNGDFLTFEQYMNEPTLIVDISQSHTDIEMENDLHAIIETL